MAESNWWEEWEVPNFDDWGYDAGSDQDDTYGLTAGLGSLMEDESWMSDLFDPSDWSYDQSFDPGDDSWMSDLFDSWSYDTGQDDPYGILSSLNQYYGTGSAQDDPYGILSSLDQYGFGDSEQPWDLWNSMASANQQANQQANQPAEDKGMFGLGIGPRLKDFFLGSDSGDSGDSANKWGGFLGSLLGSPGTAGAGGTGLLGGIGGLLGGLGGSPLGQLLLFKYLNDKRKEDEYVPIGQQAFAQGNAASENVPDYRIFNLQPALMPGVGYANQAPPGMKDGGLTGLSQKIGEGIDNYAISPYLAEVGFFEDPSFAKYVEGARLYNQNTKAPGMFKSVAPFIDDSFEALRDGYEAFLKSFKEKRGLGSLENTTETMQKMKHGGVHGAGKDEGPGDITLAKLEPGEFVMTRKATQNIGAQNLYKLMKEAERMS